MLYKKQATSTYWQIKGRSEAYIQQEEERMSDMGERGFPCISPAKENKGEQAERKSNKL